MRTWGIVLIVLGILVFMWASQQASNVPNFSPALVPMEVVRDANSIRGRYHLFQLLGAGATLGGGALLYLQLSSRKSAAQSGQSSPTGQSTSSQERTS